MVKFITRCPLGGDSRYAASKLDQRPPTKEYITQLAQTAERAGFDMLLLPTANKYIDPITVASALIAHTEQLELLIAVRPGFTAPALFARQLATLNDWSEGRAHINVVTGGSPADLASDGDFLEHDTRYRRTREFIQVLKLLYSEQSLDYDGEFYKLRQASLFPKNRNFPRPHIYFGGASDIGKAVAAEEADIYLLWGETLDSTKERIDEMKALAAAKGRQLGYGMSIQVVLGDTEEEACRNANDILSKADPAAFKTRVEAATVNGESEGRRRMHRLMQQAQENDFRLGPNLWAGLSQVLTGNSIALVGTPDQVADRIVEYVHLGFEQVLLRGFPHLESIEQIGRDVLPRVKAKLNSSR